MLTNSPKRMVASVPWWGHVSRLEGSTHATWSFAEQKIATCPTSRGEQVRKWMVGGVICYKMDRSFSSTKKHFRSLDSSVDMAIRLWAWWPRSLCSIPGRGKRFSSITSRPAVRPTPSTIKWVNGAVSPGVKRQRREANHSFLSRSEVENEVMLPLPHTSSWSRV